MSAPATSALAMSPEYCRPPSPMTRHAGRAAGLGRLGDGGDLRHADAGDDAGGADGAGPDADLDAVSTGVDQGLRPRAGGDVAADDVDVGAPRLGLAAGAPCRVTARECPCAVSTTRTSTPASTRPSARFQASSPTPTAAPTRSRPAGVLGGQRVLLALGEVLHRDEPAQPPGVVDERQLLDLVPAQQLHRLVAGVPTRPVTSGIGRHDLAHQPGAVGLEAQVAVGDDADQHAVGVDDGQAGDAVAARRRRRRRQRGVRGRWSPAG